MARVHLRNAGHRLVGSEDLVQSAFKEILVDFRTHQLNASTVGELLGLADAIIHNKVRNLQRRDRVRDRRFGPALQGVALASALAELPCREPGPADKAQMHDLLAHIWDQVNEVDRQFLTLCEQGLCPAEAARRLGMTPGAGRMRLVRLRKQLKDAGLFPPWLDDDGDTPPPNGVQNS